METSLSPKLMEPSCSSLSDFGQEISETDLTSLIYKSVWLDMIVLIEVVAEIDDAIFL